MGIETGIQWTNHTWNPWRGCTKVSPGCKNCYMFTEQRRYGKDPTTVVRTKTWGEPLKWQKAAVESGRKEMVFTCSWSDWFHEAADAWRNEAWDVIRRTPSLIYQILTKRPENTVGRLPIDWPRGGYPNVWLGVSVEDQQLADERIQILLKTPAAVRFLSCEPLLGPVDLRGKLGYWTNPDGTGSWFSPVPGKVWRRLIDWVIVGGESGHGARPCDLEWIRSIVQQCQTAHVPVFVKQLGAVIRDGLTHGQEHGWTAIGDRPGGGYIDWKPREPKGGNIDEFPADLRVRNFPEVTHV